MWCIGRPRKGLGNKLGPDRAHLILHTTLVDLFGTTLSVPTLAFRLNTSTGAFSMATAGHRSFWHIRRGVFQTLRARPGTPLGCEPAKRARPFEMNLQPGDQLFALTAGVFEVESPTGDMLKESSLRISLLKQLATTPERTGASMIQEILERHAGHSNWLSQATAISLLLR